MGRTGSIAIANAVLRGRGALFGATGVLILVTSAVAHANLAHALSALVFGLCMVGIHELRRVDDTVLGTPWARVIRLTDVLSLLLLFAATFGPLVIMATGGHIWWDVPMLAGVLIIWWCALDVLVSDYRRILSALGIITLAWLPLVLLHPTAAQLAYVVGITAAVALSASGWAVWRAMRRLPAQYRFIDTDTG